MKSTELRIGNFVRDRNGNTVPVTSGGLSILEYWESGQYAADAPLTPAPIQTETLDMLGWNKSSALFDLQATRYYIGNEIYMIVFSPIDGTVYLKATDITIPMPHINSMHLLQNLAYALIGKDGNL